MFSAWNSVSLLVVSLSLCVSTPTPPLDCESMLTSLTLDTTAKIAKFLGGWNFIEGFTDSDLLESVDSSRVVLTLSPDGSYSLSHYDRINGTCEIRKTTKITRSYEIIDMAYHSTDMIRGTLLSTCVNCAVFDFTTSVSGVDTPKHSLHIFSRAESLEESDLQVFRQQASCLNFTLPASFHYNPDKEFCNEE